MRLDKLEPVFDLTEVIFYGGHLYEGLYKTGSKPHPLMGVRYKYRQILAEDDYDYVQSQPLRKKLDRAFNRSSE